MKDNTLKKNESWSDFKEFELHGWEQCVDAYDFSFTRLTSQVIAPMLQGFAIEVGARLLDDACGPGALTEYARLKKLDAVGVDFSPAMVHRARDNFPLCDYRVGDAEALDFPENSFDYVAMNFGLLHLGDPDAALHESFRVLKNGGRFAFSVWATPAEAQGFQVVLNAIERFGDKTVSLPTGPSFFKYSDPEVASEALRNAGYGTVSYEKLPLTWELATAEEFFTVFLRGTARTGGLLRAQPQARLELIREEVLRTVVEQFGCSGNSLRIPMPVMLYFGTKA